ncbi:MAG: phosphate ABC transporter permease PstA [Paracoccaceae bacterium]
MADATIDMAALSAKHSSAETARNTRKRHRAEFRLKLYGMLAILLAGAALMTLMYTILVKTVAVTNEYYLSMDVDVTAEERQVATMTDGNINTKVNLKKPLRNALRVVAGTDLSGRKARPLYELISKFEGYTLSDRVEANPDILGGSYHFEALLDDYVQLYYKGQFGRPRDAGTSGALTLVEGASANELTLLHPGNALGEARLLMREDRALEGRNARRSGDDQARAVDETRVLLDAATETEEKARLAALVAGFEAKRDEFYARADEAQTESTDLQNTFELRADDPSVFIRANKGWIKLTEMGPEASKGIIMDAPSAMGVVDEGQWSAQMMAAPEAERQVSDRQVLWLENFEREDRLVTHFNWPVLLNSDSSSAEIAGIWGALIGSFWTMMVTFLLVFPLGVMASIYLEEFAPTNRLTNFIEVNINNLAAVPSIVFGLLGLTILLSGVSLFGVDLFGGLLKAFADDPRSTPLAGGVVLALMSLPTIIIAARASIKAVPPSIRDAALGLGASKLQTSTHHVLPLAMPGILTGSIIAMAQALGETAPLIIIGMNSFIQDPPGGPLDKANVLPSLIYLWNNNSERLFDGKTAVAITVLLLFLILMNALAVVLRKRFERRW